MQKLCSITSSRLSLLSVRATDRSPYVHVLEGTLRRVEKGSQKDGEPSRRDGIVTCSGDGEGVEVHRGRGGSKGRADSSIVTTDVAVTALTESEQKMPVPETSNNLDTERRTVNSVASRQKDTEIQSLLRPGKGESPAWRGHGCHGQCER